MVCITGHDLEQHPHEMGNLMTLAQPPISDQTPSVINPLPLPPPPDAKD